MTDSPEQEMFNPSESVRSEGSKIHTKKKEIRLESALFKGRVLESALRKKGDRVCKEKDDLYERPFKVVWLY